MKSNIHLSVNIQIQAAKQKVWEALTTPSIIKEYFFGTNTISDWKPGSPITFTGEWEGKTYKDKGTILESEPGRLLRYKYLSSMSGIEDLQENYANITYELSGDEQSTELVISQDNIPDEKTKTHSENNWKMVLDNLKKLLEK